jgi:YfiH family protein
MSAGEGAIAWIVPQWPAPARVRALSTLRTGGASTGAYASLNLADHVGDSPSAVAENRRRLRLAAGLPAEPAWLRQVHGNTVADLDRDSAQAFDAAGPGLGPGCDAAVTRAANRVCAILAADCLPILFAAADGSAVAAAHAGWRGLAGGVLLATLRALALPPAEVLAWIGPGIGPRHYEVGEEVRDALVAGDARAQAAFVRNERGRFQADLALLAERQLAALGVGFVRTAEACTYADAERFFSHRRDGDHGRGAGMGVATRAGAGAGTGAGTGRQATLIWLEPSLAA